MGKIHFVREGGFGDKKKLHVDHVEHLKLWSLVQLDTPRLRRRSCSERRPTASLVCCDSRWQPDRYFSRSSLPQKNISTWPPLVRDSMFTMHPFLGQLYPRRERRGGLWKEFRWLSHWHSSSQVLEELSYVALCCFWCNWLWMLSPQRRWD